VTKVHTVSQFVARSDDVRGVAAESAGEQESHPADKAWPAGGNGAEDPPAPEPWLGYDEVFLDCDSTLSAIEGVEELARFKGIESPITRMTERAMEGEIPLEQVYAERLRLLHPTREDLRRIALRYRERVVPDVRELIAALHFLGRRVHIVSGGLAEPVLSFGSWLGIPTDCIHAVGLEFDQLAGRWWEYSREAANPAERYLDFVPGPLSESRGKGVLIGEVRRKPGRALLVGDGISDLLARPAVELFVGFGGVVRRERVAAEADVYVVATSLAPILPLAARAEEYERCHGTPHQTVFDKGLALIFEGAAMFHHHERKASFHASYQAVHPRANRGPA
jgi:phosphoserine phosphatase